MIFCLSTWHHFLLRVASSGGKRRWGGVFHFIVLLSLSSKYPISNVATRTALTSLVELLLSVLPLYSFILCVRAGEEAMDEKEVRVYEEVREGRERRQTGIRNEGRTARR